MVIDMTKLEAIKARHAVRNYTTQPLTASVIDKINKEIENCNQLGNLHIQLITQDKDTFKSLCPLFGRFKNVNNYIALVAPKEANYYERCGYYGAQLMIKVQQAGLNSCFVTNTYNPKKCPIIINPNEELVGVIAIGYGVDNGTPHKSKQMEHLCKPCNDKWFIDGMNAAMLAPTGLNKQNFFIEATENIVSICNKKNNPMSQIDSGIVKYHFEIGAGKENFTWA